MSAPTFAIRGARVFDGRADRGELDVLVAGERIVAVERRLDVPEGVPVVDGAGRTLLPGLIDAHIHVRPPGLAELAIAFGVTTVLDMGSEPALMGPYRDRARTRNDMADILTSSCAATPLGGHPAPLVGLLFDAPLPTLDAAKGADRFVAQRIDEGAEYIKLVIEDGRMFGTSMPTLTPAMSRAVVDAAHTRGRQAVAHVHTLAAAWQAIESGVDGLVHLFLDAAPTPEIIDAIAARDVFVVPTLTLLEAMVGKPTGAGLADDPRVVPHLDRQWRDNLRKAWRFDAPGRYEHALDAVTRLRTAGVSVLAGTDAACLGVRGTAPGVSLHRELELLVEAGFPPRDALAAATSRPAQRFGLDDRGWVAAGCQADLVLVAGDPLRDIGDTLSIDDVWRRGERLVRPPAIPNAPGTG